MVLQTLVLFSSLLFLVLYSYGSEGFSSKNCSQTNIQNSQLVLYPCSSRIPVNQTECLSLGCCWNHTVDSNKTVQCFNVSTNQSTLTTRLPVSTTHALQSTRQPTSTSNQRDGFCVIYDRPVCSAWLNQTKSNEGPRPRFIGRTLGVNKTDNLILKYIGVINNNIDKDEIQCKELLRIMLCQFTLTPCDIHGGPIIYCREDCDEIFKRCQKPLTQLLAVAKYIIDQSGVQFVHIGIPNCTELKYSYDMANNETCEHFGLFDFQKTSKPSPNKFIWFLVGGIGAFIVVIIIIAFIVARKRRMIKAASVYKGVTFTAVTMRDRLRADTMLALDETKLLSLYNPDEMTQFPLDRVEYVRDLGEGNFGQVFQGRCFGLRPADKPNTELMVAVKTLKAGCSKEMKTVFLQEVTLMSVLHHENIVELLAVSTEEEPYGMIFEFMALGDLNQFLRKHGPFRLNETEGKEEKEVLTREDLLSIALQVANGMEYLQSMRFVHRDLATRNCLVGDSLAIKIADFGMSRDVYASDYYKVEGQAVMPIRWMPPEALLYGKFTVESDIYSYGVLLWEVYTFSLQPYYGYTNEEVVDFVKKGVHLGMPDDCEPHVYEVMKSCWNRDAIQRPSFDIIKARLKNEECQYDVPAETVTETTLQNPLYMNTILTDQAEPTSKQHPSPAATHKTQDKPRVPDIPTGYMNIGYKDGKVIRPAEIKLEDGEQEI
ncbi:muscle, skeletal receptor tyrosine protein kinase-like isoform X3 [Actinia tenebrosa]|uniref:Muscle, skeletal receptor tyrosine protein kinase-like isoform X3 n=1 Tax=Actinia tenebrosa TaxID=6105 RepID=A0A6P8HV63_ACTTE|nr:muscle, skeletal receptor tyrosine protein kinase-like isoform X3 [Actinia tenebrosa]